MALHTRTRGRIGALAVAALVFGGIVAAAPASADETTAPADGILKWGFRQSFRNYVGQQIAALPPVGAVPVGERITLVQPAQFDLDGTPAWAASTSSPNETLPYLLPVYDFEFTDADNFEVGTTGGAEYHFPSHAFEVTVENVGVVVVDGDASVVGDLSVVIPENILGFEPGTYGGEDVVLGEVGETVVVVDGDLVTVTGSNVTLTELGASALQDFLPEGAALDNFSVSFLTTPSVTLATDKFGLDLTSSVAVEGRGFYHGVAVGTRPPLSGKQAGAYVVVGYFPDVWRPSAGAPTSARPAVSVANGGQKWAVPAESIPSPVAPSAGGIVLAVDGSFTTELVVDKAVVDAAASAITEGNYGVYTYPGSGAVAPSFEIYTPIEFLPGPVVVTAPQSVAVLDGATATFAVEVDTDDASFQWESKAPGAEWVDVAGATSSVLEFPASIDQDRTQFRVTASTAFGAVTSDAATLTVTLVAPAVTAAPKNASVKVGSAATFTVAASGKSVAYQWQSRAGSGAWANVAGATASTLEVATTSVAQSGTQYRVVASNPAGSVESAAATLTVTKAAPSVKVSVKKSFRFASKTKATVTVGVPAGVKAAAGKVTVKVGSTVVGKGTVKNGKAQVTLTKKLLPGSRKLVAEFAGGADLAAAKSVVATVKVSKAKSAATAKLAKSSVKAGKRATLRLTVKGTGVKATGKVRVVVTQGKKTVRTITVKVNAKGKATVKLPKLAKGKYAVKAQYLGSKTVAKKAAKQVTLRVR